MLCMEIRDITEDYMHLMALMKETYSLCILAVVWRHY